MKQNNSTRAMRLQARLRPLILQANRNITAACATNVTHLIARRDSLIKRYEVCQKFIFDFR